MLDTTTDLKSMLSNPDLICTQAFVAGKWTDAKDGKTFDVTNPARGDVIAQVADLSRAEVADAIDAAYIAQKDWAKRTGKDRANVLKKWFTLLMENQADLAKIMTAEQGKPLAEALAKSPMVRPLWNGSQKRPSVSTAKPSPATCPTNASLF